MKEYKYVVSVPLPGDGSLMDIAECESIEFANEVILSLLRQDVNGPFMATIRKIPVDKPL